MNKEDFETRELQFDRIYNATKDFGRTQFVREIQMQINTNKQLQQENKQLKLELLEKKCSDKDIEYQEKLKLQERIDKAIEYINFIVLFNQNINGKFSETLWGEELLERLKGEEND